MDETKIKALAQFLKVPEDEIEHQYENEYTVNRRPVKEGTAPYEYMQNVNDLKLLLTANEKARLTRVIKRINDGKTLTPKQKNLYEDINRQLKIREYTPAQLEALNRLSKATMYVENVLYHLLETEYRYGQDSGKNYRTAWTGKFPEDDRRDSERSDGDYLVLTDDEADELMDASLDSYLEEFVLNNVPEEMQMYFDEDAWKRDALINSDRGSELNRYDGTEYDIDIDGETYYIYQTN